MFGDPPERQRRWSKEEQDEGGASVADRKDPSAWSIMVSPHRALAAPQGSSLEPAECGWLNGWGLEEAGQAQRRLVQSSAVQSQQRSLCELRHLSSVFHLVLSNLGEFLLLPSLRKPHTPPSHQKNLILTCPPSYLVTSTGPLIVLTLLWLLLRSS